MGPSGRVVVKSIRRHSIISANSQPLDVVVMGDSWSAFGHQRGTTVPTISYDAENWAINYFVHVSLTNCPSGMNSSPNVNNPALISNRPLQGREGFSSKYNKGKFVDALARLGIEPSKINLHEYACGGTTAGLYPLNVENTIFETTFGAFDQRTPTIKGALLSGYAGYGIDDSPMAGGGFLATDGLSAWMQKQNYLQDPGHDINDPMLQFKNYTLCDMIAYPPTGRVLVLLTLGGNDIFGKAKQHLFIDPMTGAWDPDGAFADVAESIASADGAGGSMQKIIESIYLLNPNAEVVWPSYMNMPIDEPGVRSLKAMLPTPYGPDPANAGGLGPTGWKVYSGDGANTVSLATPRPEYAPPHDNPFNMESISWPAGPQGTTVPVYLNIGTLGFFKDNFAWTGFTKQRDATYPFIQPWYAHYFADSYAWQGTGTTASPGVVENPLTLYGTFPNQHFGPNYQWHWINGDGVSDFAFTSWLLYTVRLTIQGHQWRQIYNAVYAGLDNSLLNQQMVLNTTLINFDKALTILTKDLTTKNISRLFRDQLRPRMAAAESHWQGLGRKFYSIDVFDAGGPTDGTSQDDPVGVPTLPKDNFVEGVHLSSLGIDFWQTAITTQIKARSHLL